MDKAILAMPDEEFERIVGSMHNAETARKYRQVMKTKISQESKLQIEDDFEPLINHFHD